MSTATTTPLPPVVTILPGEPDNYAPKNWIEDNQLLLSVIVISMLIAAVVIYYCWKRTKRRGHQKLEGSNEAANSQVPTSLPMKRDGSIGSSPYFFIIRTPETPMMEQSTNPNRNDNHSPQKQTLAVPPAYMVKTHRKSAPCRPEEVEEEPKPTAVGWARSSRWSTAGVEIPSSQPPTVENGNIQRTPPPAGFVLSVPMLYRRISYDQNHAVYAPEPAPAVPAHPEYLLSTTESIHRVGAGGTSS